MMSSSLNEVSHSSQEKIEIFAHSFSLQIPCAKTVLSSGCENGCSCPFRFDTYLKINMLLIKRLLNL